MKKIITKLEKEFAEFIGVKYAIATSLGRNALFLILRSLDIKRGDEVIVPGFICSSVIAAVKAALGSIGHPAGVPRRPLRPFPKDEESFVIEAFSLREKF